MVRGNITTNLRVNFAGSLTIHQMLVAEATWATGLLTNLKQEARRAMSEVGILRTCQPAQKLSACRRRPKVIGAWGVFRCKAGISPVCYQHVSSVQCTAARF